MEILTTITVKQILTENSKSELRDSFMERKLQLEKEIAQLQFEMRRMMKSKKYPESSVRSYFDKEVNDRHEKIKLLEFQLEQLELLPIGSELKETEVQGLIDVKVGDNWNEVFQGKTIIVKDGVVIDIRKG